MRKCFTLILFFNVFFYAAAFAENGSDITKNNEVRAIAKSIKLLGPSVVYIEGNVEMTRRNHNGKINSRFLSLSLNGIFLDKNGLILTTFLDKKKANKLHVWWKGEKYKAEILKNVKEKNLSIIKINTEENITPIKFGSSIDLTPGQRLYSISATGRNMNYKFVGDTGIFKIELEGAINILLIKGMNFGYSFNRSAPAIVPGMAMPIADGNGDLVGFVSGKYIFSIDDLKYPIKKMLREIKNKDNPKKDEKPWIGMNGSSITEDYAKALHLPWKCLVISTVFPDSPAAKIGLKPLDAIIKINGKKFKKSGRFALQEWKKKVYPEIGLEVKLTILRDGKKINFTVKYEKQPKEIDTKIEEFGLTLSNITPLLYMNRFLATRDGMYVKKIERGGAVVATGNSQIFRGDVITEIDGIPVKTTEDVQKVLKKIRLKEPKSVIFNLFRGNYKTISFLNLAIGKKTR